MFYTQEQLPASLPQRLEQLKPLQLIGKKISTAFVQDNTFELWKGVMQERHKIMHSSGPELYSVQVYPPHFFNPFSPDTPYDKWAAKAVSVIETIPDGMDILTIPEGLYSVFSYTGSSKNAAEIFQQILGIWLPYSDYLLDDRPHFEILGDQYKNGDPQSEEEIWIPVKPRV